METHGNLKIYNYQDSEEIVSKITGPSIFLAGPTVRGNQPHLISWRIEAVAIFKMKQFEGSLIIPEFTSKTESDENKKWVPLWEYNGLKKANCIMFWIPRTKELIGLTTNMELGLWMGRQMNKVVYGRPDDAYRISYLDIMWEAIQKERGETEMWKDTLSDTIDAAIIKAKYYNGKNPS